MKRFLLYAVFLLSLPSMAHHWVLIRYHHSGDHSVVGGKVYCTMCGLNSSAPVARVSGQYCTCHGYSLQTSFIQLSQEPCDPNDNGAPMIGLSDRIGDYYGSLPQNTLPAIDYDALPNNLDTQNPMLTYYPNGTVLTDPNGQRYAVTDSPDGENRYGVPLVNGVAEGYQGGKSGTYTLTPVGEGQYATTFTPAWSGGVSQSGSSSSLSGGGSSSSVSGSAEYDKPLTTTITDENGQTHDVVSAPSHTATLPNGSTITTYDYTSLLNAIGSNVSKGFDQVHDDLNTVNENLRKQLETDEDVNVAENTDPSVDTSSVEREVQEQLDKINEEGSGWRFDFGLGSNPIGNLITSFFGNPPTNFGQQNDVCNISFELPLVGTLQYQFRLSDWFPPAFRSCLLMILTIVFAIASAKAVSGAFQ